MRRGAALARCLAQVVRFVALGCKSTGPKVALLGVVKLCPWSNATDYYLTPLASHFAVARVMFSN